MDDEKDHENGMACGAGERWVVRGFLLYLRYLSSSLEAILCHTV